MERDGKYNERIVGTKAGTSHGILHAVPVSLLKLHSLNKIRFFFSFINQVLFLNKTVTSFLDQKS